MFHRLSAIARPALAIAMLLVSLAMLVPTAAAAAQNDRGLIDDSSYQSPQFGYGVTWAEPWSTNDRDVITNPGGFDTIAVRGDGGTVRISGRADSYGPLTFLQDTIAIQLASGGDLINQDTTGVVPTAELLVGNDRMRIDVLSLPDAGAIVLVSLRANQADFDASFASAGENIQLDGGALFDASAGPMDTPEAPPVGEPDTDAPDPPAATPPADGPGSQDATPPAEPQMVMGSGVEGNTYTSPNFGFSVSWDPAIWSAPEDGEFSEPGYDTVTLESAAGPIWLSGVEAYNGSASTCLLGEITYYNDPEFGITEWQVAVDAEGNELTGETETSAWGVFTNVYTFPDDPTAEPVPSVDYIECHGLGDGESVVIFYSFAERDAYNEHIGNVLAVVESLELADVVTPAATPGPLMQDQPVSTPVEAQPQPTPTPASAPDASTPVSGGDPPAPVLVGGDAITGQSHAYSFTIAPGWQVNDSILGGDVEVTSLTNGVSTVTVEARAMSPIDLSQCVSNSADEDKTESAYADLVLSRTASGEAFAGADDFTAFANFTFTGPDGESWAHFIECRWIVEGESVLIVTQDVPRELFGSERSARRLIQNSIEINP